MDKNITIIDKDYKEWVKQLGSRYRKAQICAAVKVNHEMLRFYWCLGQDIVSKQAENLYGSRFYATLSVDLKRELGVREGLSPATIRYTKRMYELYAPLLPNRPCIGEESRILQQVAEELRPTKSTGENLQQAAEKFISDLCSVPWGHHMLLIDKCSDNPQRALFYIRKTMQEGWSRSLLLNFIGTGLYEREGKGIANFANTLPPADSDLAQEITRDPYCFGFAALRKPYNEAILKEAL